MNPNRALRALLLLAVVIATTAGLIACGDSGGGSTEDPKTVLEQTFSGDHKLDSGRVQIALEAKAEGKQSGDFKASFGGPFQSKGEKFPAFAFDVTASGSGGGQNIDFDGGLISTGDKGYVSYKGTDYEVDQSIFSQITSRFEAESSKQKDGSAGSKFFSNLGIQPANWLENLKNEGTEDVEGTEAVHVSGQANTGLFVEDLKTIIDKAGNQIPGGGPSAKQLDSVKGAVKSADFDIYSGTDDHTLRKLVAALVIEPPSGSGAQFDSLNLNFSLTFSDLNEKQEISAPSDTKPLSELLQQFGVNFGGLGGASSSGSSSGAGGGGANSAQSQRYLECLRKAQGSSEIQNCAKLLQ